MFKMRLLQLVQLLLSAIRAICQRSHWRTWLSSQSWNSKLTSPNPISTTLTYLLVHHGSVSLPTKFPIYLRALLRDVAVPGFGFQRAADSQTSTCKVLNAKSPMLSLRLPSRKLPLPRIARAIARSARRVPNR